ncbi:MAG: GIY-YIG nuclease family protein [Melioribacteraceae bacterium]
MKDYYIYIMTNNSKTLYIGITNDLKRRVYEHKMELIDGFTKKYKIHKLVYFEITSDINSAIKREKQLKNWHRQWKINLIETQNQDWADLAKEWFLDSDAETSSA